MEFYQFTDFQFGAAVERSERREKCIDVISQVLMHGVLVPFLWIRYCTVVFEK